MDDENKYEKMMEKAEALAKSYAEAIGSERHFGTDLFSMKAERALWLDSITKDDYDKMMDLAKAVHVSWSFHDVPDVKVLDFKRLERILDGKPGEEPDSFIEKYVRPLKEKAEEYKGKIGTSSEIGSKRWYSDLSAAMDSGKITETEFSIIKYFTDYNTGIVGQDENAKNIRWAVLAQWLKELPELYSEADGKNLSAETMAFFKNLLKEDEPRLSISRYAAIYMAFKDMESMEESAFYSVQDGISLKDLEQKSKGLSIWIWILIQLCVFGIFLILAKGFFIGAVMLWGVCTPVVLPLQLIGGAFLACAIANAVTFGDREPSEEYKAEEAAVLGGMIVGGIHAGIGCAKELSKPGWIKDSKKV